MPASGNTDRIHCREGLRFRSSAAAMSSPGASLGRLGWRFLFTAAVLALGFVAAPLPQASADTLKAALADAYRNSPLLEANRALLRANDENLQQALAATRPAFALAASSTWVDPVPFGGNRVTTTISLSASLTIYDNGVSRMAARSAEESIRSLRASLKDVEQQVFLAVAKAYLDLLRDERYLELARNSVKVLQEQLQATEDRFAVGEVTRTDVAQARARLEAAKANLAARKGSVEISRAVFREVVGRPPRPPLVAPGLPRGLPGSESAARKVALAHHPRIIAQKHAVKAAEYAAERAKAAMGPMLTGSAALSGNSTTGRSASVGLSLTIPLYQGGKLTSLYRQALENAAKSRADLLGASRQIAREATAAFSQLEIARAAIAARKEQLAAAETAFEGVREEARLGVRTTLDVLNAQQEVLSAGADLAAARRDYHLAGYSLLAAAGRLTASGLALPVKQYDPMENYRKVNGPDPLGRKGLAIDRILRRSGRSAN